MIIGELEKRRGKREEETTPYKFLISLCCSLLNTSRTERFLSLCLRATMALRLGMLKCAAEGNNGCRSGIRRWAHVPSMVRPLDGALESYIASPHLTLPELDANQDTSNNSSNSGLGLPGFSFGGSMELMAVPKRKVKLSAPFMFLNIEHLIALFFPRDYAFIYLFLTCSLMFRIRV